MPLHDHFHPPWSVRCPWEAFHSAWATSIAYQLNGGLLPADYYAIPLISVAGRVEVDVATYQDQDAGTGSPVTATVWAPPQPALRVPLEVTETDSFEVQILRNFGGPQLRAAIELVSPRNKDRPAGRRAFAAKCAGLLRRGVSVVIVDFVTERQANLHADIWQALELNGEIPWQSPTQLYAVAYRSIVAAQKPQLEVWPEALALGAPLPILPLWLEVDLSVPLRLEESYRVTCGSLRMPL